MCQETNDGVLNHEYREIDYRYDCFGGLHECGARIGRYRKRIEE